jgi:Zn-dependent M28 family amino/carboxypeptidase
MKFFFVIILFMGCFPTLSGQGEVSDSLLRRHVGALAHDSMKGRFTGRSEIALAARYIAGQMDSIGLKKIAGMEGGYLIPWNMKMYKNVPGEHVVGVIPGNEKKGELIIFSAHYDHVGTMSSQKAFPFGAANKRVKGDSIFNGANDDATGVAAMLELARLFSKERPAYTLMFVAFSGEELGLLGSADFNQDLNPASVKMNVNLEMLGRPEGNRPYIVEEEDRTVFLELLNRNLVKTGLGYPKSYFNRDPYPQQRLFTRSDNYSFHKRGIPSFTIMATDPEDIYYHSAADEAGTIQFPQMRNIVQSIYLALLPVVTGGL